MRIKLITSIATGITLVSASAAMAGKPQYSGGSVKVSPDQNLSNMTLTVSGPNRFHAQKFAKFGVPSLSIVEDGKVADGLYVWELTGATSEKLPERRNKLNDGRGKAGTKAVFKGASESGTFIIKGGAIVIPSEDSPTAESRSDKQ